MSSSPIDFRGKKFPWLFLPIGLLCVGGSFCLTHSAVNDWYLTTRYQHGVLDNDQFATFIIASCLMPFGIILTLWSIERILARHPNSIAILILMILLSIISLVLGIFAFIAWDGNVWLSWDTDATSVNAAKLLNGLFLLLLVVPFSIVLFFATINILKHRRKNNNSNNNNNNNNHSRNNRESTYRKSLLYDRDNPNNINTQLDQETIDRQQKNTIEMENDEKYSSNHSGFIDELNETNTAFAGTAASQLVGELGEFWESQSSIGDIHGYKRILSIEQSNNNSEECIYSDGNFFYQLFIGKYLKYLFLLIILPLLFVLNGYLPSDWHTLTPAFVKIKLESESIGDWTTNFKFLTNDGKDTNYFKFYGSTFAVYLFIFVICSTSAIARKWVIVRKTLQTRIAFAGMDVYLIGQSVTIGELIAFTLFVILLFIHGYYWFLLHAYEGNPNIETIEQAARGFGLVALFFIMFLLFTVTRISLWVECFGVSFEHLIAVHRLFGTLTLLCVYIHGVLFFIYFANDCYGQCSASTMLPFNSNPPPWHEDNFTPFLMYYLAIFALPIGYGLCLNYFRRNYFDYFYYTHLIVGFLFLGSTLWHASQSWRYVIPPLILYGFDRCMRFYNSCQIGNVDYLKQLNKETTLISFRLNKYRENLSHKCGQYYFINIPQISSFEWHPFTVSSAQDSKLTTMHIKSMGGNQWTKQLQRFSRKCSPQMLKDLEIHIDGPYGKSLDIEGYSRIILVGGGIGITPCHSIFATHLNGALKNHGLTTRGPQMHLYWITRNQETIGMFDYTWQKFEEIDRNSERFTVDIYVTRSSGFTANPDESVVAGTKTVKWHAGRPIIDQDLTKYFDGNEHNNNNVLIFVCGPLSLVKSCEKLAIDYGAHFAAESFEF